MKLTRFSLLAVVLVVVSSPIYAVNQESSEFNVRITIKESCNISTANAAELDFSSIDRASTDAKAKNDLTVTCTDGTPYRVALKSPRIMTNTKINNFSIPYMLYQDANQTKPFGYDLQDAYSNTGTGKTQKIPVWGQVKQSDTNVPAGQYSDTVTVAISY